MENPSDRLKWARQQAGFKTIAEAARAKGFHKQNLSDHEGGRRGISPDQGMAYAKAFRVNKLWLLYGDGTSDLGVAATNDDFDINLRRVPLVGEVRAGVWAEIPDTQTIEDFVPINLPAYARAELFALRVFGRSMDRIYQDGSIVVCALPSEAGVRDGDHVVVRRSRGQMCETTLKEVVQEGRGKIALHPRSTDPAYQTPLYIDPAKGDVEIIGVVVASYIARPARHGPLIQFDAEK